MLTRQDGRRVRLLRHPQEGWNMNSPPAVVTDRNHKSQRLSTTVPLASSLPSARRQLLNLMQQLNFGRIEQLTVRAGQPVLEPPPRIIRERKFGGEDGPRQEQQLDDFALKVQAIELFEEFDRLGNGVIESLTIKHGLPFSLHMNYRVGAL